jgi:LPS-assembly protein
LPARAAFAPATVIRRLLIFLLGLAPALAAAPPPPVISADMQDTDLRTQETILTGNPRITYGATLLTADEIRYNRQTGTAVARGHAQLTAGARRLVADVITYHQADGTYTVENLRMGEYPLYILGTGATGNQDGLMVRNAEASVREPGPFIPTLRASELYYSSTNHVRAKDATVGVGDIRAFRAGNLQQDLRAPLISYVSATGGYRSSLGAYVETGLHIPVRDGLKLGGDLGIYTNRGIMFGPSGAYQSADDSSDYRGYFRSGTIRDHGDRLLDILGRPVPSSRSFFSWQHQQQLTGDLTFNGQFNYWSDSEVLRDFRSKEFFQVQQPDSFLESVYRSNNYFVSAFARLQPNTFEAVQQRLPELRFDLLPLAVGGGFYERFNGSLAVLRDTPPAGGPTLSTDRLDAYYALTRPFTPREWLSLSPIVGGRVTHYTNARGGRSTYTRTLGEVGFDAALRASAVYDYKNELWQIDGLRHLLTPRLSYRYIPSAERGARYIPPIDRRVFSTYLQPLGLGDQRNLDDLTRTHTLRLGLDNTVQTRDPVYGSRDLLAFNLAADYRFDRAPGVRPLSEIHTDLALTPAHWVQFDVYESFSPQSFKLREFNSGLTLRDGDAWSVRFSSNFLRDQLEDYFADWRFRVNETFEAVVRQHYDSREHRFIEQSYGVRQNLSNTWRVEYAVTLYSGPRRESSFGFNVQIEAIGF